MFLPVTKVITCGFPLSCLSIGTKVLVALLKESGGHLQEENGRKKAKMTKREIRALSLQHFLTLGK